MSRVKFLNTNPKDFFRRVQYKTGFSLQELANTCKVHRRSFSDWEHDRYLMPFFVFRELVNISCINPPTIKMVPEYWHVRKAGKKGAMAKYKKFGTFFPGWTKEASIRGGLKAVETHRQKRSKFFVPKPISFPKKSPRLAEFVGVVLGDGGLTRYQLTITLHKNDDKEFIVYIKNLIDDLFSVEPSIYKEDTGKKRSVVNIVVSRKKLVQFFVNMGLRIGSKVKQQVDVPSWIKRSLGFRKSCLRGLFDTDGCFYIDEHYYKNKMYDNCAMTFSNRSLPILFFFKSTLEKLGLHPTRNKKFNISLRRENEILIYFCEIGSANFKHLNEYTFVLPGRRSGGVSKSYSFSEAFNPPSLKLSVATP